MKADKEIKMRLRQMLEALIRHHFEPQGNSLKFCLGTEHYLKLPNCNTETHLYTLYVRKLISIHYMPGGPNV